MIFTSTESISVVLIPIVIPVQISLSCGTWKIKKKNGEPLEINQQKRPKTNFYFNDFSLPMHKSKEKVNKLRICYEKYIF